MRSPMELEHIELRKELRKLMAENPDTSVAALFKALKYPNKEPVVEKTPKVKKPRKRSETKKRLPSSKVAAPPTVEMPYEEISLSLGAVEVKREMKESQEQLDIIEASKNLQPGQTLKIDACAGSGKTTTLVKVAEANPDKRFLYLAFNRSIADKAGFVFPANTVAMTIHSLAYRHFFSGQKYRPRLGNVKANMLTKIFPSRSMVELYGILMNYKRFLISSDKDIMNSYIDKIFTAVQKGKLLMMHDHYLKMYQMLYPEERHLEDMYDCILVDESQDSNPVTLDIVNSTACSKIYVGDSHQSIYGFRGAINALAKQKADITLHLTNSFRSRQEILDKINVYMDTFTKKLYQGKVEYYLMNSMLDESRIEKKQIAYITRTNSKLIELIDDFYYTPHDVYLVKSAEDVFKTAIAVYEFMYNRKRNFFGEFSYLNSLPDVEALKAYADAMNDVEVMTAMKIARKYGGRLYSLKQVAQQMTSPEADVVLTNAHVSKGMEWAKVVLMDDFPDLCELYAKTELEEKISASGDFVTLQNIRFENFIQELDLYYVAVTRGQLEVDDRTINGVYPTADKIEKYVARQKKKLAAELAAKGKRRGSESLYEKAQDSNDATALGTAGHTKSRADSGSHITVRMEDTSHYWGMEMSYRH